QPQGGDQERGEDGDHEDYRDPVERVPSVDTFACRPRPEGDFGREPVEEHEDEEGESRDGGDQLALAQLVELHLVRARAACRVFASSIAIVIGPPPPGTGVIAAATSATASRSTSPTKPSSVRLVPTSITTAPGLTASAPISRGTPAATTRTSARR